MQQEESGTGTARLASSLTPSLVGRCTTCVRCTLSSNRLDSMHTLVHPCYRTWLANNSLAPLISFCFLLLCWSHASLGAQRLGERDFAELSPGQIQYLASTPDPLKNLDPDSRSSHLSKILIPRPGECELFCLAHLRYLRVSGIQRTRRTTPL